jgi:hypothetical protein
MLQLFERLDDRLEGGRFGLLDLADAFAAVFQQFADAGLHVFGADGIEGGQCVPGQQGIGGIHAAIVAAHGLQPAWAGGTMAP